jgi:Fe-S oxidoreductase
VAGIDLPSLILETRRRIVEGEGFSLARDLLALALPNRTILRTLARLGRMAQAPLVEGGQIRHLPMILSEDHGFRALPAVAPRSFRELFSGLEKGDGPVRAALFSGCAHEFLVPEELVAGAKVLARGGATVSFPERQGCCGLPAQILGKRHAAVVAAASNVLALVGGHAYIVTLCASCASHIQNAYPALLAGKEELAAPLERLIAKIIDFSSFVKNVLKADSALFEKSKEKVAYHAPCHLCRGLKVASEPRDLIRAAGEYVETEDEDLCCGFGGSFSLKFPEESAAIMTHKLKTLENAGVNLVVTDCPGCVVQLRGGEERRGRLLKVEHMAVFLERSLRDKK